LSITVNQVLIYIVEAAESIIEDDLNESEEWTDEEFAELQRLAFSVISQVKEVAGE
jgi:hypothetical protein